MATIQRATKKNSTGGYVYLDSKNNSILTPSDMDATTISIVLAKLARYEDLQESGRLHCFPCNIGGKVYVRATFTAQSGAVVASALEATVKRFVFAEDGKMSAGVVFSDGTEADLAQGEFYTTKEAAIVGTKTE